jgi:hypothetical protein
LPKAVEGGYRLVHDAGLLWSAFEHLHPEHGLPGALEIPMKSFTRAVEIVLKDSELRDGAGFRPGAAFWNVAVRNSAAARPCDCRPSSASKEPRWPTSSATRGPATSSCRRSSAEWATFMQDRAQLGPVVSAHVNGSDDLEIERLVEGFGCRPMGL